MASYSWKTAPSWNDFTGTLSNHKAQETIKWSETQLDIKSGGYTPSHGDRTTMKNDTDLSLTQGNFYTPTNTTSEVCEFSINAGSEHYMCGEIRLNPSTWINNIKGVGFEYCQNSGRNNAIHLRRVATLWYNASSNAYRGWGWSGNYEGRKETVSCWFETHDFRNTDEATWQTQGWRFHGFIFEFRTTSGVGSSFWSKVSFFNLKLYIGAYTNSSTPRFLIPRFREYRSALATPTW